MGLSYFDQYLLGINIIGFISFVVYIYSGSIIIDSRGLFDKALTVISLLFGSLGIFIAIIFFAKTPKTQKKTVMMSRVFISCILVIQLIVFLMIKGIIAENLTFKFWVFFKNHQWMINYLMIINIITFLAFAIDKYQAIKHRRRIRIVSLLSLSFFGGTLGGLLGMYMFRHKTKQDYFTVGLPLMLAMQIVVLFYVMNII